MSLLGVPNFGVEVAKYLEREQHRRTAVSEWQPIETAPKDGRQVLLSGMNYSQPWVWQGWFDHEDERGWFAAGSHWTDADDGQLKDPTHWQPLPLPPPPEVK